MILKIRRYLVINTADYLRPYFKKTGTLSPRKGRTGTLSLKNFVFILTELNHPPYILFCFRKPVVLN